MTIHARPGKVFVELDPVEERSAGGIYLPEPEGARSESQLGTVIACAHFWYSPDGVFHPMDLKVGDRVLIGKYSGVDVTLNHRKLVALSHTDLLAVLDPASCEVEPCQPA